MRIAYLVHFRGGEKSGIFHKVATHADAWSRHGQRVGLFVATGTEAVEAWAGLPQSVSVVSASTRPHSMIAARERLARHLMRWRPDVVYARHTLAYPGLVRIVLRCPTVFEINSDDLAEFRLVSSRRYLLARLTRGMLLGHAAGLVFVTHELSRNPSFTRYRRRFIVLTNGVRVADYPMLPAPTPRNPQPRLVFLGHPHTPWHGLDRIEALARALPTWQFDVIGPAADDLSPDVPRNVERHSEMPASEYRPLLSRADAAIGTLGLYRNLMDEAAPLKTREYLAYGLPTIIGYLDSDFEAGAPFLLRVPNAPGIADSVDSIQAFVADWQGRRVPRDSIANIDVTTKEHERLAFLEGLARHGSKRPMV